ncbi:MAG: efflux RND transporter permease subunit [Deltaproteobacteria bacterium]|nr:efflux RND transporter permease subunit [Deltaproteobacteria bacterium]
MNRAIAWFVHNPVAANLLMLVMVVGGLLGATSVRQEEFPAIEPEAVRVTVEYRGASPEEVEESICLRVEEAIEGTPNLDRINTIAVEGACNVTVELLVGSDVDAATPRSRTGSTRSTPSRSRPRSRRSRSTKSAGAS